MNGDMAITCEWASKAPPPERPIIVNCSIIDNERPVIVDYSFIDDEDFINDKTASLPPPVCQVGAEALEGGTE